MPSTDLVPCFYAGQPRWSTPPAKLMTRCVLLEMKKAKLGQYVDDGKAFQFSKKYTEAMKPLCDGPLGIGNVLPFAKPNSTGDKLHYEIPMAGDRSIFRRHYRKLLHPSSRGIFSRPGMQWANYNWAIATSAPSRVTA